MQKKIPEIEESARRLNLALQVSPTNGKQIIQQWENEMDQQKRHEILARISEIPARLHRIEKEENGAVKHYLETMMMTEQQLRESGASHIANVDTLAQIFDERIMEWDQKFQANIKESLDRLEAHREELVRQHDEQMGVICADIEQAKIKWQEDETLEIQQNSQIIEEMRTAQEAELRRLTAAKQSKIHELEEIYRKSTEFFSQTLEFNSGDFEILKASYDALVKKVESMSSKLMRLKRDLRRWNDRERVEEQEFGDKVKNLKEHKQQMAKKEQKMKRVILHTEQEERRSLLIKALEAHKSKKMLSKEIHDAGKVLRRLRLVRELEIETQNDKELLPSGALNLKPQATPVGDRMYDVDCVVSILEKNYKMVQSDLRALQIETRNQIEGRETLQVGKDCFNFI